MKWPSHTKNCWSKLGQNNYLASFTKACLNFWYTWELFINDVTAYGGRGYQGFCDDSSKALLVKWLTMGGGGGGVRNCPKFRDVIYGRPLRHKNWISFFPERSSNQDKYKRMKQEESKKVKKKKGAKISPIIGKLRNDVITK